MITNTTPQNAGWYPDPRDSQSEIFWDGTAWTGSSRPISGQAHAAKPGPAIPGYQPAISLPPQEKSSGVAVLLTIFWPGAGHLYLGLTKKGTPYVVANAVALVLGLMLFIFLPITLIVWLVTLVVLVGSVTDDTNAVNDAMRRGQRING